MQRKIAKTPKEPNQIILQDQTQDVRLCLGIQFEKGINWKSATVYKIWSSEASSSNLNRSNLKRSKVETNDATGCRKSIWICRKKNY